MQSLLPSRNKVAAAFLVTRMQSGRKTVRELLFRSDELRGRAEESDDDGKTA